MTKRYELLREGELTEDGQYFEPGSVTWPNAVIPIVEYANGTNRVIGSVTNFQREDNRITGEADVDVEHIAGQVSVRQFNRNPNREHISSAMLIQAYTISTFGDDNVG